MMVLLKIKFDEISEIRKFFFINIEREEDILSFVLSFSDFGHLAPNKLVRMH